MPKSRTELIRENRELKEQVADLEDRLDQVADLVVQDDSDSDEDDQD